MTDSGIRINFQHGRRGKVVAIELWENDVVLKGKKAGRELDCTVMRIASETLDRYVGRYRLTPEIFLKVSREGAVLFLQIIGREIQQMCASTETRFFVEGSTAEVEFNGRQTRPSNEAVKRGRHHR